MIAALLRLAVSPENQAIHIALHRHALVEARHFLGLYRRRVRDRDKVKAAFRARIPLRALAKGIHSASDLFFFIKLAWKLS